MRNNSNARKPTKRPTRTAKPAASGHVASTVAAIVGTAALGAAAMYLLDPSAGSQRRRYIARSATDALSHAGEATQSAWNRAAEMARTEGGMIVDGAGRAVDTLSQQYDTLAERYCGRQSAMSTTRKVAAGVAGTLALSALGSGIAYFFSPSNGAERRASVGRFANRLCDEAVEMACGWTNSIRNVFTGQEVDEDTESGETFIPDETVAVVANSKVPAGL